MFKVTTAEEARKIAYLTTQVRQQEEEAQIEKELKEIDEAILLAAKNEKLEVTISRDDYKKGTLEALKAVGFNITLFAGTTTISFQRVDPFSCRY